jgi:hemerythrin-like domain-containing protein
MEAVEMHHVADLLLFELDNMPTDQEEWLSKVHVLRETISRHIKDEERDLFKKARQVISKMRSEEMVEEYLLLRETHKEDVLRLEFPKVPTGQEKHRPTYRLST